MKLFNLSAMGPTNPKGKGVYLIQKGRITGIGNRGNPPAIVYMREEAGKNDNAKFPL